MAPTIGRTVLVEKDQDIFPAIITAVHSPEMINCRIFEDSESRVRWLTSVAKKHPLGSGEPKPLYWWFWPPGSPAAIAAEAEDPGPEEPAEPVSEVEETVAEEPTP